MRTINIKIDSIKGCLAALGASILYTAIMIQTSISAAISGGATGINYPFYFWYIIFPLLILYILGFSISIDAERAFVGWIIIGYTFVYCLLFLFYIATPTAWPPIRIEGTVFLSEFGWDLFIFGLEVAILPAFIFNTLLFSLLKMKTHLIVSIVSTISSILLFIFTMQIYMGV